MHSLLLIIGVSIIVGAGLWYYALTPDFSEPTLVHFPATRSNPISQQTTIAPPTNPDGFPLTTDQIPATNVPITLAPEFIVPLDRPEERITKKPFGIYITPATSPIQPEIFSGYHTGVDFEILPGEEQTEVTIRAFCGGTMLSASTVNGYGGVVIQSCTIGAETVTALYGHLDIQTVIPQIGNTINPGDEIGLLGEGYSTETDGERKHLHFALHRGSTIEYRGYVRSEAELDSWINPDNYFINK